MPLPRSPLRAATEEVGNGLTMLRVAVDAEAIQAAARGDTHAAQCLQDALVHLDEALDSLVAAGASLDDIGAPGK